MGHLPSLPTFSEEALKEARELKTPDMGGGSSVGGPFWDCFTGAISRFRVDLSQCEVELQKLRSVKQKGSAQAKRIKELETRLAEARAEAISRFRVDLSQCEVELQKVSGERYALRLLCSQKDEVIKDLQANLAKAREEEAELYKQLSLVLLEYGFDPTLKSNPSLSQLQQKVEKIGLLREEVDQIKAECDRWKETIDRLAAEKESILAKLLSADVQLRSVKQKGSAQAKRIKELETRLAEARAEVESSKVMADKSIVVYRADAEAAQMEVREAVNTPDT
ncbi:autophagy-related protein 23-like [Nicotiana tomentosiformis]|uniref:autophagy-related protein 23-like n=1 Tax=Nicotiana tomentosiformis TaxID=4098 RepID=UPI00388C448F